MCLNDRQTLFNSESEHEHEHEYDAAASYHLYGPRPSGRCPMDCCSEDYNGNSNSCIGDYEIDFYRIESSIDLRTTCMIRNIPNKYTQSMLVDMINETHHGTFDFIYLRMDFKNKCNVGYAFINFIEPSSIVSFAKRVLGKRWPRFNSDKICHLSYARIQGKQALMEKFRHSKYFWSAKTHTCL